MNETGLVIGRMSIFPIIQDTLRVHIAFRGRVVALALIVVSDMALALEQIAISEVGMSLVNLRKQFSGLYLADAWFERSEIGPGIGPRGSLSWSCLRSWCS